MRRLRVLLGVCVLGGLASRGDAHFRLLEPASWLQESELGDPQWSAPCGGTLTDPGKPTGAITNLRGGDTLHIRIREMAFHPGFYRVALAVNSRSELPRDSETTTEQGPKGPRSLAGAIHYPPLPPVLADGLFMHVAPFEKDQEADIAVPNIDCAKCTLQVIEFMANHSQNPSGDYSYHHCADLQIHANPDKPMDGAWVRLASASTPPAEPSALSGSAVVAARQASLDMSSITFHEMTEAMKAGREAKSQFYPATALAKWAGALAHMFPPGTGKGETTVNTRALDAVWRDRAGFEKAAANYAAATSQLAELAKASDTSGFTKQLEEVNQACRSCHSHYKEDDQGPGHPGN